MTRFDVTPTARARLRAYLEPAPDARVRLSEDPGSGFALALVAADRAGDRTVRGGDIDFLVADGLEVETVRIAWDAERRAFSIEASTPAEDPGEAFDLPGRVRRALDRVVNPLVDSHGGSVHLVEVVGGEARVEMRGGCQGCTAARATLADVVERALRRAVPELCGVRDVTDHAAGASPWLAAAGCTTA